MSNTRQKFDTKKQLLQDLQVFFLIFNCQTPAQIIAITFFFIGLFPLKYLLYFYYNEFVTKWKEFMKNSLLFFYKIRLVWYNERKRAKWNSFILRTANVDHKSKIYDIMSTDIIHARMGMGVGRYAFLQRTVFESFHKEQAAKNQMEIKNRTSAAHNLCSCIGKKHGFAWNIS